MYLISCDYTVELSGNYYWIHESNDQQVIANHYHHEGDKFIPCTVIDYDYNNSFIIAAQKPQVNCFFDGLNYNIKYYPDPIEFWIISHKDSTIYGPLNLTDFLKKRNELGVPEKLKLKLYL
jgi:hypothetical protein